jgi:hypothetical protein
MPTGAETGRDRQPVPGVVSVILGGILAVLRCGGGNAKVVLVRPKDGALSSLTAVDAPCRQ